MLFVFLIGLLIGRLAPRSQKAGKEGESFYGASRDEIIDAMVRLEKALVWNLASSRQRPRGLNWHLYYTQWLVIWYLRRSVKLREPHQHKKWGKPIEHLEANPLYAAISRDGHGRKGKDAPRATEFSTGLNEPDDAARQIAKMGNPPEVNHHRHCAFGVTPAEAEAKKFRFAAGQLHNGRLPGFFWPSEIHNIGEDLIENEKTEGTPYEHL